MKPFLSALLALALIAVGANQVLMQVVPSGAQSGTSANNADGLIRML